jgi:hypothetical protein
MDVGIVFVLLVSIIRVPIKALVLCGGEAVSGQVESTHKRSRGSNWIT